MVRAAKQAHRFAQFNSSPACRHKAGAAARAQLALRNPGAPRRGDRRAHGLHAKRNRWVPSTSEQSGAPDGS